ncbi:ABC transporter ATP-binding protein [Euzebya sp.]|uniref:ABC transporter ATP-binding protein n=1 Tax=Euzebya sp. TaxID=1971409 RepID=UPI0035186741
MVATDPHPTAAPPDTTALAIDVRGLVKAYDGRRVVDEVDLVVPAGQVVALLGPNGAGKTTTVECIEGFRRPDEGAVRVLGLDPVADRPALAPHLGVMLQEGGVWQAATPREVLRLYARLHPARWDPEELLEALGLTGVARSRYRSLSGGEKQRLNLALALVGRPRVLILDEPTTGMDPEARTTTWELIRRLRGDGVSVLLTTHFMREAEHLADQVAVMGEGRVLAVDSPAGLVARYAPSGITITTPDDIDADALSAALGGVPVVAEAADRWLVEADAETAQGLLGRITGWFTGTGHHLTGVTTGGEGLETAYLELTRQAFGSPARLPEGAEEVRTP